jgi:glutathione synthase/RimK-type ligase-like ATP-grasp enzyme
MILLWGIPEEEPVAAVHRALQARGARTAMVDQRRALSTRLLRRKAREMAAVSMPEPVADKCRIVTKTLGLLVAGIDRIRGRDGEWYFLEANPSPAFTFYPDREKVAAAIARLLIGHAAHP